MVTRSTSAKLHDGDGEFNLKTMTKNYLIEVMTKNPYIPMNKLGKITGIPVKTLKERIKEYDLESLRK